MNSFLSSKEFGYGASLNILVCCRSKAFSTSLAARYADEDEHSGRVVYFSFDYYNTTIITLSTSTWH